jgi:hypothetical protein
VLDKLTPNQRYALGPIARPSDFHQATILTRHTVSSRGAIGIDGTLIGLGRRYAATEAIAFRTGDYVAIFIDDTLARALAIDRTRRYQPIDH